MPADSALATCQHEFDWADTPVCRFCGIAPEAEQRSEPAPAPVVSISHRVVGGSSRGSGRERVDAITVERAPAGFCDDCGGPWRGRPGMHSVLWRLVDGKRRLVNCVGKVVSRLEYCGQPYDDEVSS